jgi:hypothetical protein
LDKITLIWSFITCTLQKNIIRMMKSRKMRGAGPVARMEDNGNDYRVLVGKPEGQRSVGKPIHKG